MTDEIGVNKKGPLNQLDPSNFSAPVQKDKTPRGVVGQDEFLQMLVAQLKTQDPLDPMSNDQFAVDLAQFSQLEQLVSINEHLEGGASGEAGFSSLATYLGHQVTMNSNQVQVADHQGGMISFTLPTDAAEVSVELVDDKDAVVERLNLGAADAGKHTASLANLATESGEYTVRLTSYGTNGQSNEVEGYVSGIVNGFVPGPEPKLLVGDREVQPSDVREVRALPATV